jgi:hypothetical protein
MKIHYNALVGGGDFYLHFQVAQKSGNFCTARTAHIPTANASTNKQTY